MELYNGKIIVNFPGETTTWESNATLTACNDSLIQNSGRIDYMLYMSLIHSSPHTYNINVCIE